MERGVGVQREDAERGQEMEEKEARHYFPQSALQAWVRHFCAGRKIVSLVVALQRGFGGLGREGPPLAWGGGEEVSYTLGEEGPGEV